MVIVVSLVLFASESDLLQYRVMVKEKDEAEQGDVRSLD